MKWTSLFLTLGVLSSANAATIAVIDSGLDYRHEMIVPNLWTNPHETFDNRDEDGNGYQDDVHGWSFAEQNSEVIDYSYLGTFSNDPYKFFEIQAKQFMGTMTEEDREWVQKKFADPNFVKEVNKFGNFIHGTHVAGIAIRGTSSQAMGIKLIPTEVKPFLENMRGQKSLRWTVLEKTFEQLAKAQMGQMTEIARFINGHNAEIANGSFGTGFAQIKMITDNAFRIAFFRKPKADESDRAAKLFMDLLLKEGKNFVAAAPRTLFVFAAGNDGTNNDEKPVSPANIRADNSITVAATYENQYLAPFSCYGVKHVDIAAPGMLINSAVPGDEYLPVSGTSQAAPYVANVAARVKDANPNLRPVDIKRILMETVDKKPWLADKVVSGGTVNPSRAITAARLTVRMNLNQAIAQSKAQVKSLGTAKSVKAPVVNVTPIPLAPLFK
ncbi:MAG: S8 family serine peptidase [Bacteriovoracaceae bacterium]